MVVNIESVVGYNNKLKKAKSFMIIGVNSDLNIPVRLSVSKHNFGSAPLNYPTLVLKENILNCFRAQAKKIMMKQRKRGWLRVKQAKQARQAKRRLFRLRTRPI